MSDDPFDICDEKSSFQFLRDECLFGSMLKPLASVIGVSLPQLPTTIVHIVNQFLPELLNPIVDIIMDFWFRFPNQVDLAIVTFHSSVMFSGEYQVEELETANESMVGRIGTTTHAMHNEDGPQFLIVWIHPSNMLLGVVYLNEIYLNKVYYNNAAEWNSLLHLTKVEGVASLVCNNKVKIVATNKFVAERCGGFEFITRIQSDINPHIGAFPCGNLVAYRKDNGAFYIKPCRAKIYLNDLLNGR